MKKTKFLVLALAVAVMLLGAGYAAWTDSVEIESTVTTGKLDVDFVSVTTEKPEGSWVTIDNNLSKVEALAGDDADNGGSQDYATFTLGNLYPGATAGATVVYKNVGTIPVKLNQIAVGISGSTPEVKAAMKVTAAVFNDGIQVGNSVVLQDGTFTAQQLGVEDEQLAKDKEVTIEFDFEMLDGANEVTEDETVTITITQDFKQFNM